MITLSTEVLVVGAGPTGLATAISLAERGVDFLIIDALQEAQNTSRAAVIHAATLESLIRQGVGERLIEQGLKAPSFRVRDRDDILAHIDFSALPSPTPYALMIPQDETEAILTTRLAELGGQARRPVQFQSAERTASGVRALCEGPEGRFVVEARYLVGADGGHSRVRDAAGISFPGLTYGSFLLADVRMDWPFPPTEVSLFFSEAGTLVVAPMSGGRHRVVAQYPDAPSHPTIADVQRILDRRGPRRSHAVTALLWGSRFQVHHRLADQFRSGPFLLVGDAAHVHSPAGGQGMNLGLLDAEALGEALEAVVHHGCEKALDRYASERRRAAQEILTMTHRLTKVATLRQPTARWVRNRIIGAAFSLPLVRRRAALLLAGLG